MSKKSVDKFDKLTGVFNHDTFGVDFHTRVEEADESKSGLSIAMIDIDWFKKLNDEYGHQAGDDVLKMVAGFLAQAMEGSGDVYRYAGDEFILLMPNVEKEEAFLSLEQMRNGFGDELNINIDGKPKSVPVSLSIGVTNRFN